MEKKHTKPQKEIKKRPAKQDDPVVSKTETAESNVVDALGARAFEPTRGGFLTNPHLSPIQRQELARTIGQTSGNQHLYRVIQQMGEDSTEIQKQDGEMVARGGGNYEIVAGDSLWKIAETTYGQGQRWRDIYTANPGKAARGGDLILIGTVLTLPVLQVPATTAPEVKPANGGVQPAVGPIGMSTEFGSFDIYPDDFVGPLPLSVRTAESWPIKQADFDVLNTRLTAVKEGSSKLSVDGTDTFKTGVYLDLAWLMTSPVGQELIQELQNASHTVKIVEGAGGNGENAENFDDGLETTDAPPKAGPGSNATINFNPLKLSIGDGTLNWHTRPPAIGLAHEMVHAWADVYGRTGRGETGGVKRYEHQAVGIEDYKEARISENKFRAAFGLPIRPVY